MSDREQILRHISQTLFRPILEEFGRDAPGLRDVEVTHQPMDDRLVVTAYFQGQVECRNVSVRIRDVMDAWHGSAERHFAREVIAHCEAAYSREYEDHQMRTEERAFNEVFHRAMAAAPPDSNQFQNFTRMRDEFARHVRTHHRATREPPTFRLRAGDGPIELAPDVPRPGTFRQEYECDWDLVEGPNQTATEVRERHREASRHFREAHQRAYQAALHRYMRMLDMAPEDLGYTEAQLAEMEAALRPGAGGGNYVEAQKRGMELLKANLTPAQLEQYQTKRNFDVRGGKTGRIYRIHHGRQMNIAQYKPAGGTPITGLCFLPRGNLVEGDVMLAQKMTLEAAEDQALKVANKFPIDTISPLYQMIEPPPEYHPKKPIRDALGRFFSCDPIDTV